MTSFAYPLRLLTRMIYCKLTERKRHFKADEWVELIFASATFAWLAHYVMYKVKHKHLAATAGKNGIDQIYMTSVIMEMQKGTTSHFKMNFLLAVVAASFWFKVLMMLQLTKTFGPMIKIVVAMLKELSLFSILWIIQLFIFACIGYLIFGELPEYSSLANTLILLLQSSLG